MDKSTKPHLGAPAGSTVRRVMLSGGLLAGALLTASPGSSQTQTGGQSTGSSAAAARYTSSQKSHARRLSRQKPAPEPVVPPPPPPMPHWPINDTPNPASVVWDSSGLHISASNSSLQQILTEVSTDTGTKIVGPVPDQRVYGTYGPGDAREVLSQLLQGSGYNILLAGDIGKGAPSEIVLTPRRSGSASAPNSMRRAQSGDPDEDAQDQPDEEPQPQVQQPQMPSEIRPGFGPNGPMRTPQQVMEEMQQRQLLQQQQMQQQQQQQQQGNPTAPQSNPQQ